MNNSRINTGLIILSALYCFVGFLAFVLHAIYFVGVTLNIITWIRLLIVPAIFLGIILKQNYDKFNIVIIPLILLILVNLNTVIVLIQMRLRLGEFPPIGNFTRIFEPMIFFIMMIMFIMMGVRKISSTLPFIVVGGIYAATVLGNYLLQLFYSLFYNMQILPINFLRMTFNQLLPIIPLFIIVLLAFFYTQDHTSKQVSTQFE